MTAAIPQAFADHAGHPANPIEQNDWKVSWSEISDGGWPNGDGLQIGTTVQYRPNTTYQSLINTAKVPSIYVEYSNGVSFTDELIIPSPDTHSGQNHFDKHNISTYGWYFHHNYFYGTCTYLGWSTAANGCYKYEVYYSFRDDNQKLSPWVVSYGPGFTGVGTPPGPDYGNPIYEIRWRIDNAVLDQNDDGFATYTGSSWVRQSTEFSQGDPNTPASGGYQWKVFDYPESGESLYIDPYSLDTITWHDGSTKKATIYALVSKDTEDEGPPSLYKGTETIATGGPPPTSGSNIVIWYVGYLNWDVRGCSSTTGCVSGADLYAKDFT